MREMEFLCIFRELGVSLTEKNADPGDRPITLVRGLRNPSLNSAANGQKGGPPLEGMT